VEEMVLRQDLISDKPTFTEDEIENLALGVKSNSSKKILPEKNLEFKWKLIYSLILYKLKKSKKKGLIHYVPIKLIKSRYIKSLSKFYLLEKYSRSSLNRNKGSNRNGFIDNFFIAILIHEFDYKDYHKALRKFNDLNFLKSNQSIENDKINNFLRYYMLYHDFKLINGIDIMLILLSLNITERNFNFIKTIYSNVKYHLSNEDLFKLKENLKDQNQSEKKFLQFKEEKLLYNIKTVKILKIVKESNKIKTIIFNSQQLGLRNIIKPKPGQFIMIWVPEIDEKPMSISGYDDLGNISFSVKDVGACTKKIHELKVGDFIGVRGPLGNYFTIPKDRKTEIILVGGGIGMAPLKCLADKLKKENYNFTIIEGATCNNSIIYKNYFKKYKKNLCRFIITTDDGSTEYKGNASKIFSDYLLKNPKQDYANIVVYTCGPEKMIYEIFKTCEKYSIKLQASLERMMRCGCGICGLCAVDPLGLLVCKDGPIFDSATLRQINDFGKFKRDITGQKIPIE